MNFKKTVAIAAAVGALGAISVPAMALENEFHGFYQIKGFLSNFNDGGAVDVAPNSMNSKLKANNYAEQRARIFYTAKASDDLKLVTGFELDTRFGGITDGKYTSTNDSGKLDSDGVSLETKWVYLDFNATKNVNIKTGVMPYKDSIKGLLIDADVPALYTTTKLDPLTLGLGYSRFNEGNQVGTGFAGGGRLGDTFADLFIVDASLAISKDIKAGLSYYLLADNSGQYSVKTNDGATTIFKTGANKDLVLHTVGLNAEAKLSGLTVSGFAAIQAGTAHNYAPNTNIDFHGYALNAAAKLAAGPGTAKAAVLYTSGDENSDTHYNGWIGSGVQSYNESGLMLLVRNNVTSGTTTTNEFVKRSISNVALATVGYDATISPKAYANANLGMAWAAKNAGAPKDVKTGQANGSNYMGTELALEGGYKVYDNLTASLQASYLALGGYYKNAAANSTFADSKSPDNPYTARIVLTYAY